jgi:membrane protein HdeD
MITKLFWKILLNGLVVVPMLLWFTEANFSDAALTALTLSIVAYVIGDQMILRLTNNFVATVADGILAVLFLWGAASLLTLSLSQSEMFTIAAVLGVVEYFLHEMFLRDKDSIERFGS